MLAAASGWYAAQTSAVAEPGDVVLLLADNEPAFVAAFLGVLRAGAKVFPISPRSDDATMAAARSAGAVAAIARHDAAGLSASGLKLIATGDYEAQPEFCDRDSSQCALLLVSSGTTGKPKTVHRGARSLDAVAGAMCGAIDFGADDVVFACIPLFHSYGVEHGLLAPIWAGSCVHLSTGFDIATSSAELNRGATIIPAVPVMIDALARSTDRRFPAPAPRLFRRRPAAGADRP